ncbi:unnamed protein product [Bursaphelenchus xylophilus]|uniref:(pine wood nematode) hypothetical protein n=1 Tax=Bursaphelenchus xylophilus TaxID=6326 RepID=A0A1I7SWN7_BURXY|nr:unnamed protein product [Bursaphelenchus xylophilus]CAG9099724.1 unnamed protein product [Bursaphelenchus xylophilus]
MKIRHVFSDQERAFLEDSLSQGVRVDGRKLDEQRKLQIEPVAEGKCMSASLGDTRIDVVISIKPVAARTVGRPTSGFLYFDVRKTITSRYAQPIKTRDPPKELDRVQPILNRLYRDAKAIELDALCIEVFHCVYEVRVQVNVVQEDGNLIDCASAAVAASLGVVKRRAVEYDPNSGLIRFLSKEESVPSNIPMSFLALTTTFTFLRKDSEPIKDASLREYKVSEYQITVGVNHRDEVIALFSTGGNLSMELMDKLLDLAHAQCMENGKIVKQAIDRFVKLDIS